MVAYIKRRVMVGMNKWTFLMVIALSLGMAYAVAPAKKKVVSLKKNMAAKKVNKAKKAGKVVKKSTKNVASTATVHVSPAVQKPVQSVSTSSTPTTAALVTGKISVPAVGTTYSLQYLFDLINTNNPQKTSNFLIPIGQNGQPIDDSHCWQANPQITGSASASKLGITPQWVQQNGATSVQLAGDEELITFLYSDGRLNDATKEQYQKILLYFKVPIVSSVQNPATGQAQSITLYYRCYLNDPYPGRIVRSLSFSISPAASIISRWGV